MLNLSFLDEVSLEDLNEKVKKEDSRRKFEILVLLKHLKALLDWEPKTYQEILEQDFLLALYYSALEVWTKELEKENES